MARLRDTGIAGLCAFLVAAGSGSAIAEIAQPRPGGPVVFAQVEGRADSDGVFRRAMVLRQGSTSYVYRWGDLGVTPSVTADELRALRWLDETFPGISYRLIWTDREHDFRPPP